MAGNVIFGASKSRAMMMRKTIKNCHGRMCQLKKTNFSTNHIVKNTKIPYKLCTNDYHWVENVLTPTQIPTPPQHKNFPTASGWLPPPSEDNVSGKDYFVARCKYHTLSITEKRVAEIGWVTQISNIEGNIADLEEDIIKLLKPISKYDPATSINEIDKTLLIKGAHLASIEGFLHELDLYILVMAYLLGSEYCISSLKQDVSDLQQTLVDIQSRTGQVKYQSWKFPDKLSCEVNVDDMLQEYAYNASDDEESQVSHVMLYDLVIDRLVFLLQCLSFYNEALLNSKSISLNDSKKASKSMSIGLTAKLCWSRMSQTAVALQKLAKEASRSTAMGNNEEILKSKPISPNKRAEIIQRPGNESNIASSMSSIACQTNETAMDNCETCSRTQQCLLKVGEEIINICKAHSLPTSLQDWKLRFNDSNNMSIADLSRWSNYQTKDLSRLSRLVNDTANQVKPLTSEIEILQKSLKNLNKENMQKNDTFERQKMELKNEFQKHEYLLKESEKRLSKKVHSLEVERKDLTENLKATENKLLHFKDDLLQKQNYALQIDSERQRLKHESLEGQQYKKDAIALKSEVEKLKLSNHELNEMMQLNKHSSNVAEGKITSLQNHEKSLMKKHQSLLLRLGNMSEEMEHLRIQVAEAEEERDAALDKLQNNSQIDISISLQMEEKLEEFKVANQELKQQLQDMSDKLKNYEELVSDYKKNERLLVCFPDLNHTNVTIPESGNVVEDMRKQIQANEIRINTLCAENNKLKTALISLKKTERSYEATKDEPYSPVQLWQTNQNENYEDHSSNLDHSFTTSSEWSEDRLSEYTGRFNRPTSSTRTPTSINIPRHGSSAIDVYKDSKSCTPQRRSFTVGSGKRPTKNNSSKRPVSAKSDLYKPWT